MGGPGGLTTVLETVSNKVRGNLGTTRKNSRGGIRDYRGTPDSNEVCQQLRRSKGAKFAKFKVRRGSEVRGDHVVTDRYQIAASARRGAGESVN